jgi:hypothetical protein
MMAEKTTSGISKMEGVRQALAKLGNDAMPVDIQSYVKKHFGLAMTTAHVSNYKTDILRKQSGKAPSASRKVIVKKPWGKPVAKIASGATLKPHAPSASYGKAQALSVQDIETVKGLVGRVGGQDLMSLVDLLSK